MLYLISCHVDMPNRDLTVVNKTTDSLYYYIDGYKFATDSLPNMAFGPVTDLKRNRTTDTIFLGFTLNPGDTIHPSIMNKSWKRFANQKGGLTILLYKKNIERLPPELPLTAKNIFKRLDLTAKQLDSLKYRIVVN